MGGLAHSTQGIIRHTGVGAQRVFCGFCHPDTSIWHQAPPRVLQDKLNVQGHILEGQNNLKVFLFLCCMTLCCNVLSILDMCVRTLSNRKNVL